MSPSDPKAPVLAAGIVLAHRGDEGTRLLLLRNRFRGEWGFPKGHLEPGEDLYAGARREVAEETGITEFRLLPDFRFTSGYTIPSGKRAGRRKEVTYYLATVARPEARLSEEHEDLLWASPAEAEEKLPFPELRALARDAFRHLERQP